MYLSKNKTNSKKKLSKYPNLKVGERWREQTQGRQKENNNCKIRGQ